MEKYTIKNEYDYNLALMKIDDLWFSEIGTKDGDELEALIKAVEKYEDIHYPID